MIYREVTKEERLELTELQARSFFFSYDRKKYAEEIERGAPWRSGFGAFDEGGKLAAGLDLLPFDAWFDGKTVGMGGIGGVASAPEGRGGGSVRGLMEFCLNEMASRGDVFSFLYPFSYRFYRKFGYESCLRLARARASLETFRAFRQPGAVERFVPGEGGSDPAPIVEVYNDFAQHYNLSVDREGWRWRSLLERDPMTSRRHAYIWRDEDGRPGAYVIFRAEPEQGEATEMRVLEAGWRDPASLRGLLGFMGGFSSNLRTVVWELPPGLEPDLLWSECRDVKTELECQGMCRVVNAL
jgi:predicted acetyltransferase